MKSNQAVTALLFYALATGPNISPGMTKQQLATVKRRILAAGVDR
jgi:hypothetical protein